ncbi:MAG: hypothetical protein VYE54_08525 [Pseudomonadota bacterium]|nr:hypothetical protein [Pseudomonadota bacterium]
MSPEKIRVSAWPKSKNRKNNPYNYLLYEAMAELAEVGEFDHRGMGLSGEKILHLHWPDKVVADKRKWRMIWRSWRLRSAIKKLKDGGGKLVWTVHNLRPHKLRHPALAADLFEKFIAMVDGFIFLSKESREMFYEVYPSTKNTPNVVTPHIHFGDYYRLSADASTSRSSLGIAETDTTLLMFGKISEHKGLYELVTAEQEAKLDGLRIVVAGSANGDPITQKGVLAASTAPNFILQQGRIPSSQVGALFDLADAVILPYTAILNSGTAMLALSLNRPVIAPNIGSFADLAREFGPDWIHLYEPPLNAVKLDQACKWLAVRNEKGAMSCVEALSYCSPHSVAQETVAFYRRLLND